MHKRTLADWLDDLCVRFVINNPIEELQSMERICFQIEEAQWFYEDFLRPLDATLPSLKLRDFYFKISQRCPFLAGYSEEQHAAAFETFLAYKIRVPVRGAILLDASMDHVLMVRGFNKNQSWSFPRGKINKDEADLDCAIREVYEETGYDAREAGVVPRDDKGVKFFEATLREQNIRLCVLRGVDTAFNFEPRTRKEIGKIEWIRLQDLPTYDKSKGHHIVQAGLDKKKYYMVVPFVKPLKKWIEEQRRRDIDYARRKVAEESMGLNLHPPPETIQRTVPPVQHDVLSAMLSGVQSQPPMTIPFEQQQHHPPVPDQDATERVKMLLWSGGLPEDSRSVASIQHDPASFSTMRLSVQVPDKALAPPQYAVPTQIPTPHLGLVHQFHPPLGMPPPHNLTNAQFLHEHGPMPVATPPSHLGPSNADNSIPGSSLAMPPPPQRFLPPDAPKTAHHETLLGLLRKKNAVAEAQTTPTKNGTATSNVSSLVDLLLTKNSERAEPQAEAQTQPPVAQMESPTSQSAWKVSEEQQKKLLSTLKMLTTS